MIRDPGHQALTQSARGPFGMIGQETHFLLIARPEVPVQFVRVFEVIAEHLIDVRQRESGKLLDDLFSSGAMVERVKNNVERDAGSANAVNAVRVFRQRNFFQNRRQGSIVSRTRPGCRRRRSLAVRTTSASQSNAFQEYSHFVINHLSGKSPNRRPRVCYIPGRTYIYEINP